MNSPIRYRIFARACGFKSLHSEVFSALSAPFTAVSTSVAEAPPIVAISSQVAGFIVAKGSPLPVVHSPALKNFNVSLTKRAPYW